MNVVHFLHEHILAEDRKCVAVVIPERVLMTARAAFTSQFLERCIMAVVFQMVNHSATDDAVDVLKNL